ncbi:hypothetical protein [Streptomyces sp. NBRC 109706]|uniref:hypothetical protein n=1 Tax=Streptomyces sp. NBRC 109706 TaxID=1550035 RepID=UPI000782B5A8|nr:hypothetical protein [Streptomyces sp. NBRC 109706]
MTHAEVAVPGVAASLWVGLGRRLRDGTWMEVPAADYWCGRCGALLSAAGEEAVPPFVAQVRGEHRAACVGHPVAPAGATDINDPMTMRSY